MQKKKTMKKEKEKQDRMKETEKADQKKKNKKQRKKKEEEKKIENGDEVTEKREIEWDKIKVGVGINNVAEEETKKEKEEKNKTNEIKEDPEKEEEEEAQEEEGDQEDEEQLEKKKRKRKKNEDSKDTEKKNVEEEEEGEKITIQVGSSAGWGENEARNLGGYYNGPALTNLTTNAVQWPNTTTNEVRTGPISLGPRNIIQLECGIQQTEAEAGESGPQVSTQCEANQLALLRGSIGSDPMGFNMRIHDQTVLGLKNSDSGPKFFFLICQRKKKKKKHRGGGTWRYTLFLGQICAD